MRAEDSVRAAYGGAPATDATPIVELRQYTCLGGRRDELIEFFERELQDPLERAGMRVLGTFRDVDDPDRFVWWRAFPDLERRLASLESFYSSATWLDRRDATNATLLDSDNVLLLEALRATEPAPRPAGERARAAGPDGVCVASVHALGGVAPEALRAFLWRKWWPHVAPYGAAHVASFATGAARNDYPRLPVREGERVLVVLTRWPSLEAEADAAGRFARREGWRDDADGSLLPALMRRPERLRLTPTTRSNWR